MLFVFTIKVCLCLVLYHHTINNDYTLSLNIKCSKANQGRVGCQVVLGKSRDNIYPIVALLDCLAGQGDNLGHCSSGKMRSLVQDMIFGSSHTTPNSSTPSRLGLCF